MREPIYNPELKCFVYGWRMLSDNEIALDMAEGDCCSMLSAIQTAKAILPAVRCIKTYSGKNPDTEYRLSKGVWEALVRESIK